MSLPPLSYQSLNPYPPRIVRPTALSVLAIIGIVFGALGVLCLGFGVLFGAISFFATNPIMANAMRQQSTAMRVGNLIFQFFGFILSGVLLFASIGCLSLKSQARQTMLVWAIVDIFYGLIKLVFGIVVLLTTNLNNPALAQMQGGRSTMTIVRVSGIASAVIFWIVMTAFDVLLLIFFKKPEIVAAFELPNINPAMPAPPFAPPI